MLFSGSIRSNLLYGLDWEGKVDEDEILRRMDQACDDANASVFIKDPSDFPEGYSTLVGERGVKLSGGQKQRIAIARALIRKPKVLLLDEATSALDTGSEALVQAALDKLISSGKQTTIIVAHRLSTIKDADEIIVMKHGQVLERGNHTSLIEQGGVYKNLVDKQMIHEEIDIDTFELVGHAAFGDLSRKGTVGLVFLLCWLALVAYFVLLGDLLVPIAELFFPASGQDEADAQALRKVVMCVAAVLLSPMCFAGSLHALRFMCYASVTSVLLVGMVVAMKAIEHLGEQHMVWIVHPDMTTGSVLVTPHLRLFPDDWLEALYAFPMFGVSFLCHFNALPTHQELQRPTRERMRRVFLLTMALTSFLYLFVSVFGYIYACEYTCSNILLNFSQNDRFVVVARAALALVLMLNFPLITQPCRNSFYRLVLGIECCPRRVGSLSGDDNGLAEAALSPERVPSSPRAVVHVYQRQETAGHMSRNDARASMEAFDTFQHKDATVQQGSAEPTVVQRWLLTALLLGAALAMSLFMQSVMVVWSILGSTVAMLVAFILPAAFWYRIVGPTAKTWQRRAAFILIIVAVILALVCTTLTAFRLGSPACPLVKDMHSDLMSRVQ